jgi:signal transduction histidine kinase
LRVAAEHTFGDVYAASASALDKDRDRRRSASASTEHAVALYGAATWPFSTPAFVATLELAQDAILIVDRSGSVRFANAACKSLLERPRLEGRHVLELVSLDGRILRGVLRGVRKSVVWRGSASVVVEGRCRELELSVGAVRVRVDDWGQSQGFSIIARERQPEATERQGSARSVFSTLARVASAVAHDINNQIAVVLNYSFILLRELSADRPERAHMEELQQAAWRAAHTARNLLRLAGRRAPDPGSLDVNDVVRDAHVTLAMIARSHTEHTDIDQRLSREPCLAKARQSELEWLLLTLTQRLRTRLGELKHLRIATNGIAGSSRIRIHLDGYPAAEPAKGSRMLPPSIDANDAVDAIDKGAEERGQKVSAQLGYELALQVLPDNGLRYAIDLPGA